jgi:hypothetical protein
VKIAEVATLAREIAAAQSFEYPGNFGRGTLRYQIHVLEFADRLCLKAETNAQIDEDRAAKLLREAWDDLVAKLGESANGFKATRHNGFKVWRTGFTHMGRFCTNGFARGLAVRESEL